MTDRQELVNKLRYLAQGCDYKDVDKETAFDALERTVGTQNESCVYPTFKRLADLIDPTCKVENAGEVPLAKESLTTWFCSECGSPIYNDMQPSYCIYCGARVVRDEA